MDKIDLLRAIREHLADNPQDHAQFAAAVCTGMSQALARSNAATTRADQAMMAALVLAEKTKVDPKLKETLLARVASAIHPECASAIERRFLAQSNNPATTGAANPE